MSGQRGSLRRVGKTWRLVVRVATGPGPGRRPQKSIRLGSVTELPTRAAARRSADRWLGRTHPRELHAGAVVDWKNWCDRYIDHQLPMFTKGTRATQTSIIREHLRPAFDGPIHRISAERIQEYLVAQVASGAASASVRARFSVLRRMMRQAQAEGLAVTPPTVQSVKLPKPDTVAGAVRDKAFTGEEATRIVDAAPDPDALAYALALCLGLRAGEVLGLTWSAINLETGAITVRQQAQDGAIRPLKTRGSEGTLKAPGSLISRLRAYRERWVPNDAQLLFADAHGRAWKAPDLRDRLQALLEQLGIRKRGLHAFRHRAALAMAEAGCNPEVIRRALRHSSLRVTAIYLSAAPEDIAAGLERASSLHRFNETLRDV